MNYYNWTLSLCLALSVMISSCGPKELFIADKTIFIDGVNPLGIAKDGDAFWISDSDHNRVVRINNEGEILKSLEDMERPMHIDFVNDHLYIPSYALDLVLDIKEDGSIDSLGAELEMEAPAGVSKLGDRMAIADFYNHRILYYDGANWNSFGSEKSDAPGMFDYPTDVQLYGDKIYVADAYNNRGQIIGLDGSSILVFGQDQEMNAATGIFVTEDLIALTDFENDRLLIFDHMGKVLQIIEGSLHKPTDVLIDGDEMYITNYKGSYISRFYKQ